jgi:periplasmic divalent cation tolerance protein
VSGPEAVVVLVTVPTASVGERIARAAVEGRLAAAVNVVPGVRSIFRWQGRVEDESELLLILKTDAERLAALEASVCQFHPYTVPSFLALPVVGGHEPYLAWLRGVVGPIDEGRG